jgi:spore germination protein YaaH
LVALALAACSGGGSSSPSATVPPSSNPPVGSGGTTPPASPPPSGSHAAHVRCGWIGGDTAVDGAASFAANPDYFDAIHPVWFDLQADGSLKPNKWADDGGVIATAHAHGVTLAPLVNGADDVNALRTVLSSPQSIANHVQQLAALAAKYDGLDLDYEHLWNANDRPGYLAVLQQAATALHAAGKQLTVAAPAQDHADPNNAYDFVAMVNAGVDEIHLMGYDYHFLGGDHLGPIAPLGWLDAVGQHMADLGVASHAILAVANYGLGSGWYSTSSADAQSRCLDGSFAADTDHMNVCSYGHPAAGRAPHCTTSQGDVWFEDVGSVTEKVASAASHQLHGIGYWTVGKELPGFFDAVRAKY